MKFALLGGTFKISRVTDTEITVQKTNRNSFPAYLNVVPRTKTEEFPPQAIPIKHIGSFKVIPPLLSANQTKTIRLFLIGGTGDTKDAKTATIVAGDVTKQVGVSVVKSDSRLEVNLDPLGLSPGSHRVSVTIGEVKFSFLLRQVEEL
jgi:hypothetical protein